MVLIEFVWNNISDNYVRIFMYFILFRNYGLYLIFIQHYKLVYLKEYTIYLSTFFTTNSVEWIFPTVMLSYLFLILLSYDLFILEFNMALNISLSKGVYYSSIYRVWNEYCEMNIDEIYASIFLPHFKLIICSSFSYSLNSMLAYLKEWIFIYLQIFHWINCNICR